MAFAHRQNLRAQAEFLSSKKLPSRSSVQKGAHIRLKQRDLEGFTSVRVAPKDASLCYTHRMCSVWRRAAGLRTGRCARHPSSQPQFALRKQALKLDKRLVKAMCLGYQRPASPKACGANPQVHSGSDQADDGGFERPADSPDSPFPCTFGLFANTGWNVLESRSCCGCFKCTEVRKCFPYQYTADKFPRQLCL